jgi:hypothetical protein
MRFLTPEQWQAWCVERQVPLREIGWLRPDLRTEHFHLADIPYPQGSGAKVHLAQSLFSLVASGSETLLLVDDWGVWPSSQHLPLFTRFREALGEHRSLKEAPGHIAAASDTDDAVSIIATSLFFMWDCYGVSSTGRDAFYFSHDEYCYFASRDASVAQSVRSEFATR